MTAILQRPQYQRADCTVGVVHIGIGAFHRAHQAMFFDSLLAHPEHRTWGVAGVNLLPQSSALLDKLVGRQGQYVLTTCSASGTISYREIGSLLELVDRCAEPEKARDLLARPSVHMVTMTVTEAGYYIDETGALDTSHPVIAEEMAGSGGTSVYSYLREGLNARRAASGAPITLQCCDNLVDNGRVLQTGLCQYLQACGDEQLLTWLEENASFPCSMVDRITPVPKPAHAAEVKDKFGIANDCTVLAESFSQWVIEDNYAGQRPPLELVGVQFAGDIGPYENAKLRVLNGAHLVIGFQAALRGFDLFDAAIKDPDLARFFDRYQMQEALPSLGEDSPVDLDSYQKVIKDRFGNPHIADTIDRITSLGFNKVKVYLVPIIADVLAAGRTPHCCLSGIVAWFSWLRLIVAGQLEPTQEPYWDKLKPMLAAGQEMEFARCKDIWGNIPDAHPEFVSFLASELGKATQA